MMMTAMMKYEATVFSSKIQNLRLGLREVVPEPLSFVKIVNGHNHKVKRAVS